MQLSGTHFLTEDDKTYKKRKRSRDATKSFQSMKAVALQETRYGHSAPIATNVKTNSTLVSPASEKSMKMYKELTTYDINSFSIKILFQLNSLVLVYLAKTCERQ